MLAAGDTAAARAAADELRGIAAELGTPLLRAHAARAAGAVLLAEGDADAALVELRKAFNEFHALGVRYEAARTRLLIADACQALGDHDAAAMESSAARSALESLGAALDAGRDRRPGESPSPTVSPHASSRCSSCSPRGKTNRAIASELFISEKTVASHVSHIFTKLGVTSRSAATAYAYDHRLL